MLTLRTEKERSQGWNAAAGLRCEAAVRVTTSSNSSSHATAAADEPAAAGASRRVRLRQTRRPFHLALGPFHLSSTAILASASASVAGAGRPSARRTTSRTLNFLAAGGHGHRIANINEPQRTPSASTSGAGASAAPNRNGTPPSSKNGARRSGLRGRARLELGVMGWIAARGGGIDKGERICVGSGSGFGEFVGDWDAEEEEEEEYTRREERGDAAGGRRRVRKK